MTNNNDQETIGPVAMPASGSDQEEIGPVRLPGGAPESIAPIPYDPPQEPGKAARRAKPKGPVFGWLVVLKGTAGGTRFDLPDGENKIGRSAQCNIQILGDEDVSREHAMIRVKGKEHHLCDLASRNGTLLNGARIQRDRLLQDGDTLQVGSTVLIFKRA